MKKFLYAGISALLALAMIFTACSGDPGAEEEQLPQAALPMISIHPTSADYIVSGGEIDIKELSVKVTVSDAGTMSYQWFVGDSYANSGGTAIEDETDTTYTPTAGSAGTENFYYVVITNKREDVQDRVQASNPARIRFLSEAAAAPTVAVTIGTTNNQYVRGFGGMSNAFGIGGAGARYMELRDIDTMFHPETGLGFNILRVKLWYQPLEWVLAGEVEPQMRNQIFCEIVERVNSYGGYVLASPWSPPPEWKINESESGTAPSYLLPEHYNDYANHLANFARTMAENGAPIYSLSLQNEFTFPSSYEGCAWTGTQNYNFLRQVGNFLNGVAGYGGGKDIPQVKLMNAEPHNNVIDNNAVRTDATANALIDIYAYHTYSETSYNNPFREVQADSADMRKEVWMTEYNINSGGGLEAQDYTWNFAWRVADHIDQVIRVNSSNAYIWWYLKRYYSMVGDNAYGTYNGQVLPRGWIMSHWAKYATDTVRVPAVVTGHPGVGNPSDLAATGFFSSTIKVKASAFRRKAAPVSYWEQQVQNNEDTISLVIYDKRTNGEEGQDMRINLPDDFVATYAHAIISDNNRKHAPALVTLTADGKAADIFLPSNSIMSVKFTKQE